MAISLAAPFSAGSDSSDSDRRLEAGEDADHQGLEAGTGPEEKAAMDDPAGDLDQVVVVGQVADLSSHALRDGIQGGDLPLIARHLTPGCTSRRGRSDGGRV